MSEETKVQFSLFAVLAFLVTLIGICVGYLFAAQGDMQKEYQKSKQELCDRATRLEANYEFIVAGIREIKDIQKDMSQALNEHERTTRKEKARVN